MEGANTPTKSQADNIHIHAKEWFVVRKVADSLYKGQGLVS